MICFFGDPKQHLYVVQKELPISEEDQKKLEWLFGGYPLLRKSFVQATLVGPRINMITPWSTNAVEICHNMGINDIIRIEPPLASFATNPGSITTLCVLLLKNAGTTSKSFK